MRHLWHGLAALAILLGGSGAVSARAGAPPDPLAFVTPEADVLLRVENPNRLIAAVSSLPALKEVQTFETFRELTESTNARRFRQLVAYFEKQLSASWPDLLDRLAGEGAVVAVKFAPNPPPTLLVIQGRDEALLQKFFILAREILVQELGRQESPERLEQGTYHDIETIKVGKEFHAARAGAALLVSNSESVLHTAIDLRLNAKKNIREVLEKQHVRQLLPANPLAWTWFNLEPAHTSPQGKEVFAQPRNDTNLTVLFGGWLDVARRSPFLCTALCQEDGGLRASVRMPCGRDGSPPELAVHIPPANQTGTLPLMEPKGVFYSTSFYLDLAQFWEQRAKLFNAMQVKGFEDLDKKAGPFLLGNRLNKLFAQAGAHWRFFAAYQTPAGDRPLKRGPFDYLGYGLVVDMRDPVFAKHMDGILRGAALLAGFQTPLKLVEEKHGDVTLVGYRITAEPGKGPAGRRAVFLYGASPCFARVGDRFLVCSTLELGKEVIDQLRQEIAETGKRIPDQAAVRSQWYAAGGADILHALEDQLLAQTILNQALSPAEAKAQVHHFIDWVRTTGVLETRGEYGAKDFHFDIRYSAKKPPKTPEHRASR
jgi:hypothetical protein